jgi:hypothetical protein
VRLSQATSKHHIISRVPGRCESGPLKVKTKTVPENITKQPNDNEKSRNKSHVPL